MTVRLEALKEINDPDCRHCAFVRRFRRSAIGMREVRNVFRIVGGPNGTRTAWTPKTRFWRVRERADLVPASVIRLPRPGAQMRLFA